MSEITEITERYYLEIYPAPDRPDLLFLREEVSGLVTATIRAEKYLAGDYAGADIRFHTCRHGIAGNHPCAALFFNGAKFVEEVA